MPIKDTSPVIAQQPLDHVILDMADEPTILNVVKFILQLAHLLSIKNADSKLSPDGLKKCRFRLTIHVEELWQ